MRTNLRAITTVLVSAGVGVLLSACSARVEPVELVVRVLPQDSDIAGSWRREMYDDSSRRPADLAGTEACKVADNLFGPEPAVRPNRASVRLQSKDQKYLFLFFLAEEQPPEWWGSSQPAAVDAYFSSDAVAQCYADSLAKGDELGEDDVRAVREEPSLKSTDGTSVAWSAHKTGESSVLRWEIYSWRQGPLLLAVTVLGSAGEVDNELVSEAITSFRSRAQAELERRASPD